MVCLFVGGHPLLVVCFLMGNQEDNHHCGGPNTTSHPYFAIMFRASHASNSHFWGVCEPTTAPPTPLVAPQAPRLVSVAALSRLELPGFREEDTHRFQTRLGRRGSGQAEIRLGQNGRAKRGGRGSYERSLCVGFQVLHEPACESMTLVHFAWLLGL